MKKTATAILVVLVLGLVALPATAGETKKNQHDMNVSFVSCDANAKTMTFKTDKGEEKTAPMMEAAVTVCPKLKAGEMVTITCMDDDKGQHQGITQVTTAMATKEKAAHKTP
jgi:hypothetical protein